MIIDSSSCDQTASLALDAGFTVDTIPQSEFNHGGTRNRAAQALCHCDILVFLTQDAILAMPEALAELVRCFEDEQIAAAYGRQLPHLGAGPLAAHARLFNYPAVTRVKSASDIHELGLKTAFCSNSFAAYRTSALLEIGGFPNDVIFGEDMCAVARLILSNYKVMYCATALVHHSHDYGFKDEFRRYFDIGVLHAREEWLKQTFGRAEGEGKRFVQSELAYLLKKAPWLIPSALLRTALKLVAYKTGQQEKRLPNVLKRRFSLNRNYWYTQTADQKKMAGTNNIEPIAGRHEAK